MVTAFVLINVERGRVNDVAEHLASIDGIAEVYSVAGQYDLLAIIRVRTNEEMASVVTKQMQQIESIQNTQTMIAFRAYSQHDLERMFSIGLETD